MMTASVHCMGSPPGKDETQPLARLGFKVTEGGQLSDTKDTTAPARWRMGVLA